MSKKMKLILIIALSLITCLVSAFFLLRYLSGEERRYINYETYTIDPDTILQDLITGKKDVFILQEEFPDTPIGEPVEWRVEDYELITKAFHEFTSGESLVNWKLNGYVFTWDCEYFDKGPQQAYFVYFKVEKTRGRKSRFVSNVIINPRWNIVGGGLLEYYPRLDHWGAIDTTKSISEEDTLNIAEINGGNQFRVSVDNQCEIRAAYFPGASMGYKGWEVDYSNSSLGLEEIYHIDPKTGELVDIHYIDSKDGEVEVEK
ncbi:MAG: hypothetical protein PVF83_09885 [Anaerolineales bacterium]|jgi:hypothetical protein